MGYMHRPVELLTDPKKLQKSAKSVVSLGVSTILGTIPRTKAGAGWRATRGVWIITRS